ncbi:MAG: hypothetical protein WCJ31_08230 [Planctomycetia bacterium]
MWCPCPEPFRRRAAPARIGLVSLLGLAYLASAGCSSPSLGPETDIVEVERIEVLPSETEAPRASGGSESSPPTVDEGSADRATKAGPPAVDAGDATRPPAEEVPAAPAAN